MLFFFELLQSQTLTDITPPGVQRIKDMHFLDADHGIVASNLGLRITTDGGNSWASVNAPCTGAAVFAASPMELWIGCDNEVYHTQDGGMSWTGSGDLDPVFNTNQFADEVTWIQMTDNMVGYASIMENYPEAALFKTTDSGATWNRLPGHVDGNITLGELTNGRSRVFFQNANLGFATRLDNNAYKLLRTQDGGMTWDSVAVAQGNESFQMLNDSVGFYGVNLKTTDGGASWQAISNTTLTNDISYLNEQEVLVAGDCQQVGVSSYVGGYTMSLTGGSSLIGISGALYCPQQVQLIDSQLAYGLEAWPWDCTARLVRIDSPFFVSVEEELERDWMVYPNPSTGIFWVENEGGDLGTVEIWDVMGKKVREMNGVEEKLRMDLGDLHAGMYFLRVGEGNAMRIHIER